MSFIQTIWQEMVKGNFSFAILIVGIIQVVLVQNLNVDKIGSTKIFVPTKEEQDAIVQHLDDKCGTIEALIDEKQALINDMESYKFSLVYESITGKRKVV